CIKGLPTKLSVETLAHPEILEQAHIPVCDAGLLNGVASSVADNTYAIALGVARKIESGWIEIVVRSGTAGVGIADEVGNRARKAADEEPVRSQAEGLDLPP